MLSASGSIFIVLANSISYKFANKLSLLLLIDNLQPSGNSDTNRKQNPRVSNSVQIISVPNGADVKCIMKKNCVF